MQTEHIQSLALHLDDATLRAKEVERLTLKFPELSLADAYLIQDRGIACRVQRGERPVGFKMGLTSKAKRDQMNLDASIYGVLTDRMGIDGGGEFSLKGSIHPKIEGEIAFVMGQEVSGVPTPEALLAAVESLCPAMEILDSRFKDFKYFSLPDVVADNCSSAFYVLGKRVPCSDQLDISNLHLSLLVDGEKVQGAHSSAVLGNPLHSLMELCSLLHSRGRVLPAGSIVLAGAAAQAVPLSPRSQVSFTVEGLGTVSLKTVE